MSKRTRDKILHYVLGRLWRSPYGRCFPIQFVHLVLVDGDSDEEFNSISRARFERWLAAFVLGMGKAFSAVVMSVS